MESAALSAESSAFAWGLAAHVRACRCDDQVILLDLRRGKYLAVGQQGANALSTLVEHWPPASRLSDSEPKVAADTLARSLAAQGLLTRGYSEATKDAALCEPTQTLPEHAAQGNAITPTRAWRFARSAASAAWWLRRRQLLWIAQTVSARRTRIESIARTEGRSLTDAAAVYASLRPLMYSAHNRCLHDSLAMVDFLASEGVSAHWVIGVKTHPFGAHSWVQHGHTVLNDLHEHVRPFTPILVV